MSEKRSASFLVLMVNTLALQHICLQIALAVIKDTFSCNGFLEVQRKEGGGCVKDHLIRLEFFSKFWSSQMVSLALAKAGIFLQT